MKCDLHIHTYYSYDSDSSPKQIVDTAIQKGIDCLAITDHNEIKGAREAEEYAKGKPILIIPGIEVKSREGDILGLNIKEKIPGGLSAQETIKMIKGKGGLAIIAHPFGMFCSFKGDLYSLIEYIDGMEVLNGSLSMFENKKALDFATKNSLVFTAGSDAHSPEFIGRVYIEIPGKNLSVKDVLKAIRGKKSVLKGREYFFLERIKDHIKRNIIKIRYYVATKKRKL